MSKNKSQNVKKIFNKISYKYDFLNNLLSFGLHNWWKRKLINLLAPSNGEHWADLCCGTGDISFLINEKVYPDGSVVGIDNAQEILKVAQKKSSGIRGKVISWQRKDVLEINDGVVKFDGITMSYGLRNLEDVERGLEKVFSLLKEDGRAGFLDFNHADDGSFSDLFQKIYLRSIVVPISKLFKLHDEYAYIEKSISDYPVGKKLIAISRKIGFSKVIYKKVCFGQMGILIVYK